MTMIAVLFVIGVIFLGFEVFLPGGILGIFGGLALLGGCGLAFADYGMMGGAIAFIVALVLVAAVLYFEFAILPKTAMGQRLFLKSEISGKTSDERKTDFKGKSGTTCTVLAPSGYITIDGKRHEAYLSLIHI